MNIKIPKIQTPIVKHPERLTENRFALRNLVNTQIGSFSKEDNEIARSILYRFLVDKKANLGVRFDASATGKYGEDYIILLRNFVKELREEPVFIKGMTGLSKKALIHTAKIYQKRLALFEELFKG